MKTVLRHRLRHAAIGAAALLALAAARAADWAVRPLPAQGRVEATMPWVSGPNAAIAERINTLVFLEMLEAAPPKGDANAFALPGTPDRMTPVTPDGFEVLRQDDRTLSLLVSAEGCGAYCESFANAFLFDLANGRRVTNGELLTANGKKTLARKGWLAFAAAIRAEVAGLKRKPASELPDNDRATIRMTYEECLTRARASARQGDDIGSLRVLRQGAEIVFGRCTPHVIRALDDLGDFTFAVSAGDLAAALSAYGRTLLLREGDASPPASPLGQVFSGSVGGAAIRLHTFPAESGGYVRGTYYYERYRTPIGLSGQFALGDWTLAEEKDGKPLAQWSLKPSGAAWTGTWTGADGRRLPVRLAP